MPALSSFDAENVILGYHTPTPPGGIKCFYGIADSFFRSGGVGCALRVLTAVGYVRRARFPTCGLDAHVRSCVLGDYLGTERSRWRGTYACVYWSGVESAPRVCKCLACFLAAGA